MPSLAKEDGYCAEIEESPQLLIHHALKLSLQGTFTNHRDEWSGSFLKFALN